MCAGKLLAELELSVMLAAILRAVDVTTHVQYAGHLHGSPKGASPAAAKAFVAAAAAAKSAAVALVPGYDGPVDLLMCDNMYASIDGPVPFTATPSPRVCHYRGAASASDAPSG